MEPYCEMNRAIKATLDDIPESADFKARFMALITNFYDKSYTPADIEALISLCKIEEAHDEN